MTTTYKWETLPALTTYLTTEFNTLANAGLVIGAAIVAGNKMWMDIELTLNTQLVARSAGAYVSIYVVRSLDGGSTYGYGSASLVPGAHCLAAAIPFDAAVTARVATALIFIPGCTHCKLVVQNNTGQTLAATGNVLKYAFISEISE